jgi:FAD/FMN-containing dehydrogenase
MEIALAAALENELVVDAVIAQSEGQRLDLWALRDSVEQCFRYGPTFSFDVSLKISDMEAYVAKVNAGLESEFNELHNFTFGHMGDGNLHFVVSVGEKADDCRKRVEAKVYGPLADINGSVSAEHGVGLEKKPYLEISRSKTEIDLMRLLKKSLDPKGLLNPGKIFDM